MLRWFLILFLTLAANSDASRKTFPRYRFVGMSVPSGFLFKTVRAWPSIPSHCITRNIIFVSLLGNLLSIMGAVELRNKIIQLLNTDNISYLKDIFEFAEKKKQEKTDPFLKLPIEVQDLLNESTKQADRCEVTPHADVMAEVRKKYNLSK